jgi:hypothetical protein
VYKRQVQHQDDGSRAGRRTAGGELGVVGHLAPSPLLGVRRFVR